MFQMENVGRNISEMRKKCNMTQLELADQMGISFQAVSNWERGNSMPDIAKLPELAELFGVTIDALLGENSKLLESIVKGEVETYLEHNDVAAEELGNVAPLLKPQQVDEMIEKMEVHDLREMGELLPYISQDVVNDLAIKAAEEERDRDLSIVAPFASRTVMDDIACRMSEADRSIANIAPFLSKETLAKIAEEEYAKRGFQRFEDFAPFLDRACLNALAQRAVEKGGIKAISSIVPFLDKDMLSEFVKEQYL